MFLFYTLLRIILKTIYSLLYHSFAWSYDLVAGLVSLGHWNEWVKQIIPFVQGKKVLEIGFGPGHLQIELWKRGFSTFGIDESTQMVRRAKQRLLRTGYQPNLVRGLSQAIPFQPGFETVVATFPSEYIFDPLTLAEIYRVLTPGGTLLALLNAIPGSADSPWWLFRRLHELIKLDDSKRANRVFTKTMLAFEKAGLRTTKLFITHQSVTLIILSGIKE